MLSYTQPSRAELKWYGWASQRHVAYTAGSVHRREGWVEVEQLMFEQLMFERLRGRGVARFVKLI